MTKGGTTPVLLLREDSLAIVTLNRPDKLNALDDAMMRALHTVCHELDHDRDIGTVILTGGVGKAFCSGGDIAAWSETSALDFGRFWLRDGHAVFDALARLRQPLIAAINGHAFGGGLELAAVADIRIAETQSKFGLPETGLGIIPGWSGTQRAVRRFGVQAVKRMALFGEVITADEARSIGIVDEVVPTGEAMVRARALAARVTDRAPVATELTKMLINAAEGEERERVIEALAGSVAANTADIREGVSAFREKRKPDFRGS